MGAIADSSIDIQSVQSAIAKQRTFFATGETKNYDFRLAQLKKLLDLIQGNDKLILEAVYADLSKPAIEAYGSEVLITLSEIKYAIKHLHKWMKPQKSSSWFAIRGL